MSAGPLAPLRRLLDAHVVGHAEAKLALLLALVCREHVYLEGPPGTAKTLMAELVARASGLSFFFHQMHRDTRLAELVGDTLIERSRREDGTEIVRQAIEPGGIVRAQVCLLDDISRAPGEALNVLLRILNERRFGDAPIPLVSAIATANPGDGEYYNEPLDPANLDRFLLQLRVEGLISGAEPDAVRALVQHFARLESGARVGAPLEVPRVLSRASLEAAQAAVDQMELPDTIVRALLRFVDLLVEACAAAAGPSLLSDRTFLVKVQKLLRGAAVLDGRARVELADLAVLRFVTTFRVPPEVHEKLPSLIARAQRPETGTEE